MLQICAFPPRQLIANCSFSVTPDSEMSPGMTTPTTWSVYQAKTQISLTRVFAWRSAGSQGHSFFMRTAKSLIRLGGGPGWSESSLDAKVILLVFLSSGSNAFWPSLQILYWRKHFLSWKTGCKLELTNNLPKNRTDGGKWQVIESVSFTFV